MIGFMGLRAGRYLLYEYDGQPPLSGTVSELVTTVTRLDQLDSNPFGIREEDLERLLRHDSDFFVCCQDGAPLGMMWGHRGSCYVRGPGIALLQESTRVYWFWILTLPQARGKQVFQKLRDAFFHHYRGCQGYSALIEPGNTIMTKAVEKMGFGKTKMIYYLKVGATALVVERSLTSGRVSFSAQRGNRHNLVPI